MRRFYMDRLHPAVSFAYFMITVILSVVIQHPVYLCVSILSAMLLNISLQGGKSFGKLLVYLPVALAVALINPLFNTLGQTVLFYFLGRPYTLEALVYGAVVGAMLLGMLLWFGAYNYVMTDDKFSYLFARLSPSLSLLLITVFRMIPKLQKKLTGIINARKCIGLGAQKQASVREKLSAGTAAISALTSWALEGGVVTADSMNSRGYGVGKRSCYQRYRLTGADIGVSLVLLAALCMTFVSAFYGGINAQFIPSLQIAPVRIEGVLAYAVFLLTPAMLNWKEELMWHVLRSGI